MLVLSSNHGLDMSDCLVYDMAKKLSTQVTVVTFVAFCFKKYYIVLIPCSSGYTYLHLLQCLLNACLAQLA